VFLFPQNQVFGDDLLQLKWKLAESPAVAFPMHEEPSAQYWSILFPGYSTVSK
jgi:hypothetical protein